MSNQVHSNKEKKYDNANLGTVVYKLNSDSPVPGTDADTKISWDPVPEFDLRGLSEIVSYDIATETFKIKKDGLYSITCQLRWEDFLATPGIIRVGIALPSIDLVNQRFAGNEITVLANEVKSVCTSVIVYMAAGDDFYPVAAQTSGVSKNVSSTLTPYPTRTTVSRVA